MPSVAAALRQHAPKYLETFGCRVPLGHRKVLSYIMRCQTGELGDLVYQCDTCERKHWVGRSCGNRHCPNCQHHKTAQWLAKQTAKLLPVQHFVVTFTVPRELRPLLRANQRDGYGAIFNAGSQTIRILLANPKYLGTDKVGFFAALHTWGRDPAAYHPHVHFVVPGGGVSSDGSRWLQTPRDFLFHHGRAIRLYKQRFARELKKCGLYEAMPSGVLKKNWGVDIKPVGNGEAVLKYLAPYVYRVAISDNRIEATDQHGVSYRVTPSGTKKSISRTVTGDEFVRSFAQHILPSGFQKIHYYGWMSPNCKTQLEQVRWLVWLYLGWTYWLGSAFPTPQPTSKPRPSCRDCGGNLTLIAIVQPDGRVVLGNPAALHARGPP